MDFQKHELSYIESMFSMGLNYCTNVLIEKFLKIIISIKTFSI